MEHEKSTRMNVTFDRDFTPKGEGNPTAGLRVITGKTLNGIVYAFPRIIWHQVCKKPELLNRPCVYVLWGHNADAELCAYVGKSGNFDGRAPDHKSKNGDWWAHTAVFTEESLNETNAGYIELWLQRHAKDSNVCELQGKTPPTKDNLENKFRSMVERDVADVHLNRLRQFFLPLAGCDFFNPIVARHQVGASQAHTKAAGTYLRLQSGGVIANGHTTDGMRVTVLKGSQAAKKEMPSLLKVDSRRRRELIAAGGLKQNGDMYLFSRDYSCGTASEAAKVVLGRNSNGRNEWKTWPDGEQTIEEWRMSRRRV